MSAVVSFNEFRLLTSFLTIIEQARSLPTDKLRIVYISVNAIMYFIQVHSIFPFFMLNSLSGFSREHNITCFVYNIATTESITYISSRVTFQLFVLC